jgi:REP element-mobilizing transposase RayT
MPDYRRNRVVGGPYFFTLALADRRSDLLAREVGALRASVSRARVLYPFSIDTWVVLPEHPHAVWTLPAGDCDFSTRWTLIKRGFSARIAKGETRALPPGLPKKSVGFGSGGFGSPRSVMRRILRDMWIMSISTRSSMDVSATPAIGRFHHFGARLRVGITRPIGGERRSLGSSAKDRRDETV